MREVGGKERGGKEGREYYVVGCKDNHASDHTNKVQYAGRHAVVKTHVWEVLLLLHAINPTSLPRYCTLFIRLNHIYIQWFWFLCFTGFSF